VYRDYKTHSTYIKKFIIFLHTTPPAVALLLLTCSPYSVIFFLLIISLTSKLIAVGAQLFFFFNYSPQSDGLFGYALLPLIVFLFVWERHHVRLSVRCSPFVYFLVVVLYEARRLLGCRAATGFARGTQPGNIYTFGNTIELFAAR
jgi:hypothetical protein